MFDFLKKRTMLIGKSSDGVMFGIDVTNKEEVSEETFLELSNGTGGAEGYEQFKVSKL